MAMGLIHILERGRVDIVKGIWEKGHIFLHSLNIYYQLRGISTLYAVLMWAFIRSSACLRGGNKPGRIYKRLYSSQVGEFIREIPGDVPICIQSSMLSKDICEVKNVTSF